MMTYFGCSRRGQKSISTAALGCYFVCVLYALTFGANVCRAQSPHDAQESTPLQTAVHLRSGRTTLGEAMRELAKQTGLTIECADYLREHRLTLYIEQARARDVLSQIAEITNTRWSEAQPGHIILARAPARSPDNPQQISAALRAVLPADILRYLGVNINEGWWSKAQQDFPPQPASLDTVQNGVRTDWIGLSANVSPKLTAITQATGGEVWDRVSGTLRPGDKLLYAQCAPSTQKLLVLALTMEALQTMNGANSLTQLNGYVGPMERDPMGIQIEVQQDQLNTEGSFLMGYYEPKQRGYTWTGFGMGLNFIRNSTDKFKGLSR